MVLLSYDNKYLYILGNVMHLIYKHALVLSHPVQRDIASIVHRWYLFPILGCPFTYRLTLIRFRVLLLQVLRVTIVMSFCKLDIIVSTPLFECPATRISGVRVRIRLCSPLNKQNKNPVEPRRDLHNYSPSVYCRTFMNVY